LEKLDRRTLEKAEKLAKDDTGAEMLAESLRASLRNRDATRAKLRQQAAAASAKLVYLLGLPPEACLVPVDHGLVPVELLDSAPPGLRLGRAGAGVRARGARAGGDRRRDPARPRQVLRPAHPAADLPGLPLRGRLRRRPGLDPGLGQPPRRRPAGAVEPHPAAPHRRAAPAGPEPAGPRPPQPR